MIEANSDKFGKIQQTLKYYASHPWKKEKTGQELININSFWENANEETEALQIMLLTKAKKVVHYRKGDAQWGPKLQYHGAGIKRITFVNQKSFAVNPMIALV